MTGQKVLLIITDGIGHSNKKTGNAFYSANTPVYDSLFKTVPHSLLKTYGLSVGLPDGQMGNSEVGHMTIGSGRVLYQDLVRINVAIKDSELSKNRVLNDLLDRVKVLHLGILLSDGGVHSHIDHLIAVCNLAKARGRGVWIHAITDGRDVLPKSAMTYIDRVSALLDDSVKIASISGRYYAMDRDKRWERVKLAHDCIKYGSNPLAIPPCEYITRSYDEDIYDEFIKPACFNGYRGMQDGDGFIFLNYRSDRAREIVSSLGSEAFEGFVREREVHIDVACMCEYDPTLGFPVLFEKQDTRNTIAEVVCDAGLRQAHIAETEKYAHVTFFLNGGREEPFLNEERVLIPSPRVATYDLVPEMSAREVASAVCDFLQKGHEFVVVNFANGDMVGHTGNLDAAIKAVEAVDTELGRLFSRADELGYAVVLTSDHGNCEEMVDDFGNVLTNHTVGDVFCFVKARGVTSVKDGSLSNVAPTVLKLMGLDVPKEMDAPLF